MSALARASASGERDGRRPAQRVGAAVRRVAGAVRRRARGDQPRRAFDAAGARAGRAACRPPCCTTSASPPSSRSARRAPAAAPSVVLATSGSAPGHWLPAVMEAHEAGLPLLLVSADRPWEVQQAQASQTVDQQRLFGHHARAYFELGLPDAHPAALRAVPRIAAQAVLATQYPLAGAVQVNAHFRKPLEPQPSDGREPWRATLRGRRPCRRTAPDRAARPRRTRMPSRSSSSGCARRRAACSSPGRCPRGRRRPARRGRALRRRERLCAARRGDEPAAVRPRRATQRDACIGAFDALLREPALRKRLRPDLALELGAPPVSAQWLAWIDGDEAPARLVLPGARPADPAGGALGMLLGPVAALLDAAAAQLQAQPRAQPDAAAAARYAGAWRAAESRGLAGAAGRARAVGPRRAARTRHRPAAARRAAGRRGAGDRQFEPGARPGPRPAARRRAACRAAPARRSRHRRPRRRRRRRAQRARRAARAAARRRGAAARRRRAGRGGGGARAARDRRRAQRRRAHLRTAAAGTRRRAVAASANACSSLRTGARSTASPPPGAWATRASTRRQRCARRWRGRSSPTGRC